MVCFNHLKSGILLALVVVGHHPSSWGHTGSINLFVNSDTNQLYPLENFEPGQLVEFLGSEISVDGPGLGVLFPVNGVEPGAQFDVDVTHDLLHWDGVGLAPTTAAIRTLAPEFDNQGVINNSPVAEYLVAGHTGRQQGMVWGVYNGAQFWDSHGLFFLEPLAAEPGIYGVVIQVKTAPHEDTDPFVIPLIYDPDGSWNSAAETDGITRLRQATAAHTLADLNLDGHADVDDLDLLVSEIVSGQHSAGFDLSGDGLVNIKDLNEWRLQGGTARLPQPSSYPVGDANLDGVVDVSDFNLWNSGKFTAAAAWSLGDFNADGSVDVSDFNLWNENKFTGPAAGAPYSVPEPDGILLVACLIAFSRSWMGLTAYRCGRAKSNGFRHHSAI